ncbi:SUKH-4 family immunity protein [Streptomyces sp. Marseille-Q5077]|uniref:SUKH-4 family immunity protein n=1 Tax=Streptomyces sp. Marseille-Q5077 TaxID=3418995 RepID=UPI003CFBDAEB
MLRIPESDLPEGLEHPGSRRHLRDIGLPALWVCHGAQYEARPADAMRPASDGALSAEGLPDGAAAADLIVFGACEYGELYLHRHDGTVHIGSGCRVRRSGHSCRSPRTSTSSPASSKPSTATATPAGTPTPWKGARMGWRISSWKRWTSSPRACSTATRPAAPHGAGSTRASPSWAWTASGVHRLPAITAS